MKKLRIGNVTRIIIAACIFVLIIYFGKSLFSVKLLAVRLGKIAVNTFCPASLYEKHLYYLAEDKKTVVMMFGNVFPIVRFLSVEKDAQPDGEDTDIDILIGAKDTSVAVNAAAGAYGSGAGGDGSEKEAAEDKTGQIPQGAEDGQENGGGDGNGGKSGGNDGGEGGGKSEGAGEQDPAGEEGSAAGENTDGKDENGAAVSAALSPAAARAFSYEQLVDFDFVHNTFYIIPSHTSLSSELLKPEEFLKADLSVKEKRPCVLLYHTHSQEAFKDSTGNDMTIVQIGDYLETILKEQYGYEVIHVTTQFDMKDGQLDRSKAYTYAEGEIAKVLSENPQVDMVIDLHRDGVNENLHFVTEINGKPTAKVMFFNGISYSNTQGVIDYLYNPYLKDDLALSYQMFALGKTYYPDFLRCIYIEAYRYNQHLCRRSMLIEAGAQTNTFEEVKNAMEPLAELIVRELGGEKAY